MSANKYANLPDIDTAPDIYETEDVFPSSQADKAESSDEDTTLPSRTAAHGRNGDAASLPEQEGLDKSSLIGADEASKKFKKAERRRQRYRTYYAHPPSPTSPTALGLPPASSSSKPPTLSSRLRTLQTELSALETELADPSNPLLHKEREEDNVDPGELFRGLVDVRGRLDKISKGKEGRGKLVSVVMEEGETSAELLKGMESIGKDKGEVKEKEREKTPDVRSIAEIDKRVGELEGLIGSSTTALDETSPLPPPLLPLITRLNNQLQILTQPRHIDSISRRLKLLISDLDRASAAQSNVQRRNNSQAPQSQPQQHHSQSSQSGGVPYSPLQEQLLPLLTRLGPSLPHIPHILTRLRTLSTLHTSAAEFQRTLESLEEGQRKMHEALEELNGAVRTVEDSLGENSKLVKGNVAGLEARVEGLLSRVEQLGR